MSCENVLYLRPMANGHVTYPCWVEKSVLLHVHEKLEQCMKKCSFAILRPQILSATFWMDPNRTLPILYNISLLMEIQT